MENVALQHMIDLMKGQIRTGRTSEGEEMINDVLKGLIEEAEHLQGIDDSPSEADASKPYITSIEIVTHYAYNKNYGDDKLCKCGHPYYRHFDTYEQMEAVGCKYCRCSHFEEA